MPETPPDPERNRFTSRIGRAARVGANMAGAGAAFGANRLMGGEDQNARNAKVLKAALGVV
jgi:hypothetical protein